MIVYTGGTFDLFHRGHVNFLYGCKKLAGENGEVVVSLNTDEFIKKYKGKAPIMTYDERAHVLWACKYVDEVVCNSGGEDSRSTILSVNPDIVAIADDWARKDYYKQMSFTQEWLDDNDILLVYIPYTHGISTTDIRKRLGEQ